MYQSLYVMLNLSCIQTWEAFKLKLWHMVILLFYFQGKKNTSLLIIAIDFFAN